MDSLDAAQSFSGLDKDTQFNLEVNAQVEIVKQVFWGPGTRTF